MQLLTFIRNFFGGVNVFNRGHVTPDTRLAFEHNIIMHKDSDETRGVWRRMLMPLLVLIAVSGLSVFVMVSVRRPIDGDDPEPLVILSAQQGKMRGSKYVYTPNERLR
jgi:hypothetical protein